MKPIRIIHSPTRSRPLNLLLGITMLLAAALLLLSLATYHASDPSFDSSTGVTGPHTFRNWIGPTGAYLSDLLLQVFGLTAFGMPLWLGGLGWTWIRSKNNGAAWLRWIGVLLTLTFLPAALGMLPWHWRWLHVMPIEGVVGRLTADLLMGYLNLTGASIVAGVLAAGGLYFGSNFSFRAAWEWSQERSIQLSAWHDRYRNWQADRADKKAEREAIRAAELGPQFEEDEIEIEERRPGIFARMFGFLRRKRRDEDEDLLDDVPAFQRMGSRTEEPEDDANSYARPGLRPNIWERREVAEASPSAYAARPAAQEAEVVPISSRVANAAAHGAAAE